MIADLIAYIGVLSGGNQMIAGALTLAVSGFIGYALKAYPVKILKAVYSQCTISVTIDDCASYDQRLLYLSLSAFLAKNSVPWLSRSICYEERRTSAEQRTVSVGLGLGRHVVLFEGLPLIAYRTKVDAGTIPYNSIRLVAIARNRKVFERLAQRVLTATKNGTSVMFFNTDIKEWRTASKVYAQGLSALALNPKTEMFFRQQIETFLDGEAMFRQLNIQYKKVFLIHGVPGTGKTSLVRALAAEYKMPIAYLNLNDMTDGSLFMAMQEASGKDECTIVLIEDVDAQGCLQDRANGGKSGGYLTLSGFLNALDGATPLHNVIVVMTTNHVDSLDPAIRRRGRVDVEVELPMPDADTLVKHMCSLYPGLDKEISHWPALLPCQITDIKTYAGPDTRKAAEALRWYANNPGAKALEPDV